MRRLWNIKIGKGALGLKDRIDMADLKQRLVFGTIFVVFTALCLFFAHHAFFKPIFVGIIALIACGALWEYYQIAQAKHLKVPIKIGLTGSFFYVCAVYLSTQYEFFMPLPGIILGSILIVIFFYQFLNIKDSLVSTAVSFFGIIYTTYTLACMVSIVYFFPPNANQDGRLWLVYLLVVTKIGDVGGLFIGRRFGKHKLAKTLSPKKTIEGAVGGITLSLLASVLFYLLATEFSLKMDISLFKAFFLGICLSLLGQFGDLAESLIKRDGGVKDSNVHLPGLGGILDIVDSLLFTTPFIYFFLLFTGTK